MKPQSTPPPALSEPIPQLIRCLREQRVILDADLANPYGVQTRVLNQALKRNLRRFPADFFFKLTSAEKNEVITNCDHLRKLRFAKALPLAFTEHGALMAAMVLSSPRAVAMSVYVIRAFVRMREEQAANAAILQNLFFATLNTEMDPASGPANRRFSRQTRDDHMVRRHHCDSIGCMAFPSQS